MRHHLQDAIRRMFAYLELVAAPKLRELLLQLCNFINGVMGCLAEQRQ